MNIFRLGANSGRAYLSPTVRRGFNTSTPKININTSTTNELFGERIIKNIGVVKGTAVALSSIKNDFGLLGRSITGGEPKGALDKIEEARDRAFNRMLDEAIKEGANGIVGVKMWDRSISEATIISFYGTAVKTQVLSRNYPGGILD